MRGFTIGIQSGKCLRAAMATQLRTNAVQLKAFQSADEAGSADAGDAESASPCSGSPMMTFFRIPVNPAFAVLGHVQD